MTRIRCAWLAALLLAAAISLPFYFLEFRSERLRCAGGFDYDHCTAGTPYTLVLPLGFIGRGIETPYADPPVADYIDGIYARRGYTASIAKVGGAVIPVLMFCAAVYFAFRAIRRPKALPEKLAKENIFKHAS